MKVVAYNYRHPTPHLKKQTKYSPIKQQKFVSEASLGPSSHSRPSFNAKGPSEASFKMSGPQYNYNNNNNNYFPGSSGLAKKHFESSGQYGAYSSNQNFDKPRTRGASEGYHARPCEAYNDMVKHKYLASDSGDVFQKKVRMFISIIILLDCQILIYFAEWQRNWCN